MRRSQGSVRPSVAFADRPWSVASTVLFVGLSLVGASPMAEAQRPGIGGRRFRPAPAAPKAAPSRPNAPGAAQAADPAAKGGKAAAKDTKTAPAPSGAKRPGDPRPQTTGTGVRGAGPLGVAAAAGVQDGAWDGGTPFDESWRASHPAAWQPDDAAATVLLAGGTRGPTFAEDVAGGLARWTDSSATPGASRSVLLTSGESADAAPSDDLVVFPGADVSSPPRRIGVRNSAPVEAAPERGDGVDGTAPAADGTVSVLVRDGQGPSLQADASAGRAEGAELTLEEPTSAWLPLGAFAALPSEAGGAVAPHIFLELSLHRDGTVRGNYFDAVADSVQQVAGRFDRDSGRLTWRIGGQGAEFETTADGLVAGRVEATVRKGRMQRSWTLIALQ